MKKYETLAHELEALITSGTLRAGDRMPSVRELVATRTVSPSTAFEAFYLLERKGLVEARPRSGYFARVPRQRPPAPQMVAPHADARDVAIPDLVVDVLATLRDPGVVPLGSAFPDPALFPLDALARGMGTRMRALRPERLLHDLAAGNEDLRRQIALRYAHVGMTVAPQEIVVTSGAMEALGLCLRAVTKPGDLVAIESPTFYGCLQALERQGLRALEIPTDPGEGIRLDALAQALAQHPVRACWFMPNFQNPTGYVMPPQGKRELVDLLARHRVPLVEDDVYGELHFGADRPPPAKAFDRDGWVMHCSSFSKTLAPGYRVGWTAAGRFAREVERLKLMSTISVAVPTQVAVLDYLERGPFDKHLRALRAALSQRQERALAAVQSAFPAGTRVTQPAGGYFLWVQLPDTLDALRLHRAALAQGISTAPGHLFATDGRFAHFVRLNYGHPSVDTLEDGIARLGRLAGALQGSAAAT